MNTGGTAGRGIASRRGQLPWLHVQLDKDGNEQARTQYATENEAKAAAKMLGGEARPNKPNAGGVA